MKKLIIASGLFVLMALAACAQKSKNDKVPEAVKSAFSKKFPGVAAEWGKESPKEYEAEFTINGKSGSANFLLDGSWLETEMEIPISELPEGAANAVKGKYPDATVLKVFKIEKPESETLYETEIKTGNKKKEMVLKADGTIIK